MKLPWGVTVFGVLALMGLTDTAQAQNQAQDRAQDRAWIGTGRIFSNDYLGDGRDRWRTGSYSYSHLRGPAPFTGLTDDIGSVIEYRFRSEIFAPLSNSTAPGDRPYVGALSLGIATHFGSAPWQHRIGAEVTAIGPQTGLSDAQSSFHDRFDLPGPFFTDQQLADDILFTATAETAYQWQISPQLSVRPFIAADYGAEDILRVGADMRIGAFGHNALALRDTATGQVHPATSGEPGAGENGGLAFLAGADFAFVAQSAYLPADQGYAVEDTRSRLRLGVEYQTAGGTSLFYGVTYLSPEFVGQPKGQVVGSLRLNFNF